MSKVLLIYEDYSELNTVQATLKKVGFDCVGITTEYATSEQVLSFHPDIVVASGKGPKVSTVGVGRRLKEMPRWSGKVILIFSPGHKPNPQDLIKIRMDVVLEAPIQTVRLIQVLAKLTNQDDQVLMEKLIKSSVHEEGVKDPSFVVSSKGREEKVFVSGGAQEARQNEIHDPSRRLSAKKEGEDSSNPSSASGVAGSGDELTWTHGGASPGEAASLSPSAEDAAEPRAEDGLTAKKPRGFALDPESVTASGAAEVSVEKQKVDWSEVEKQLFGVSPSAEKESKAGSLSPASGAPRFPLSEPTDAGAAGSPGIVEQLKQAEGALPEKIKRYEALSGTHKLTQPSSLTRVKARQAQKQLMKDWSEKDLKVQDELRREFTKALFKKK
jgi:hypothetical protein